MTPQVCNRLLWQRNNAPQNRRTGCPVRGERKGTVELTLGNGHLSAFGAYLDARSQLQSLEWCPTQLLCRCRTSCIFLRPP